MDANEWYQLRNNRTNRIDEIILDSSSKRIGIYVSEKFINYYSTQVLILLILNILSRWCRRIVIEMPENIKCLIPGRSQDFRGLLESTIRNADPYGEFIFDSIEKSNCDIILKIGPDIDGPQTNYFWADADGWIGGYGYGTNQKSIQKSNIINPVGPCFVACQVNSAIFREYLGINNLHDFQRWYSLFNYNSADTPGGLANPEINNDINIGRIWQIGCGAVGSSFDYLISLTNSNRLVNPIC